MNFQQVVERLRDGRGYAFTTANLAGYFYKAPYPSQKRHTDRDGAHSAITFWKNGRSVSPVLLLDELTTDCDEWRIVEHQDPVRSSPKFDFGEKRE